MVILGAPEDVELLDRRLRFAAGDGFERGAGRRRCRRLGLVGKEDDRSILAAISRRAGVVRAEEDAQQFVVADRLGIEVDGDGLGMVGEVLVSRILGRAAGVADARADDARKTPELGVGTPESPEAEGRRLEGRRRGAIEGGRSVDLRGLGRRRWGHGVLVQSIAIAVAGRRDQGRCEEERGRGEEPRSVRGRRRVGSESCSHRAAMLHEGGATCKTEQLPRPFVRTERSRWRHRPAAGLGVRARRSWSSPCARSESRRSEDRYRGIGRSPANRRGRRGSE